MTATLDAPAPASDPILVALADILQVLEHAAGGRAIARNRWTTAAKAARRALTVAAAHPVVPVLRKLLALLDQATVRQQQIAYSAWCAVRDEARAFLPPPPLTFTCLPTPRNRLQGRF